MKVILILMLLMFAVALISSIIDNRRLIIRNYEITSDKVKKDLRIAFLSDLHGNEHGKDNRKLIDAVEKARPDVVIMGGDMITSRAGEVDEKKVDIPVSLVKNLNNHRIYYGIGNHEYCMYLYREDFGDYYDVLMKRLKENGAGILRNESEYIEEYGAEIQGLEIERDYYKRGCKVHMEPEYIEKLTGKRHDDRFRVLLAHNPEYFDAYSKEADLVLSGHFHGGIVRLPLIGGVISSRLSLFPKYDGGMFELDGSVMIVSRGLGSHTIPLRVFNPCELCIIDIKKV